MTVKHIAFIVKYFPTVSETFIVNQINGLIDAGYEIQLYSYEKVSVDVIHESLKTHNLIQKVQYFLKPPANKLLRFWLFITWTIQHLTNINWTLFFKTLNVFQYGKDAYTLKLFFEAQWFLVAKDVEFIHAHFGMNGDRIAYLKAKGILPKNMPLLTTFHGYDLVPNSLQEYKKTYENLLREANAFTVNTPYLEGLLQQVNLFDKPCYVLPVSLDVQYFTREEKQKETAYFDVVFCGRLIHWKGPDTSITIVKELHNAGYTQVRLHIIGSGELRAQLEALVADTNLQDVVLFYGTLTQAAIKECLEQADLFLLPEQICSRLLQLY